MQETHRVWPWMLAVAAVAFSSAARAETIPCEHRYVASKTRQFFDYVQQDRKTGFKAVAVEDAREVGQETFAQESALRRYCEAKLKVDSGDTVVVYIAVTSRDSYTKKDRAEDVQACWENKKYGEPAVIGASSGCGPLKRAKR